MQNKLIAAAALASSATALRLEAPTTTLAGVNPGDVCHGTYAYQCIETKVDRTLADMVNDVATHRDDEVVDANEIREQIVEGVQDLRASLEAGLSNMRSNDTDSLNAQLEAASDAIQAAADAAAAAIDHETQ